MAVSLSKGGNVSLTKEAPGLTAVTVGLGWDVRTTTGTDFDLDASAIAVNADGKVVLRRPLRLLQQQADPGPDHRAHRRQPSPVRARATTSDQRQPGGPPGRRRQDRLPGLDLRRREPRSQNFGQVRNAFIRIVNQAGGAEIARYDLSRGRRHRDRHGLRRAVPQRRRVEVPRRRPGLRLGPRAASPRTSASTSDPNAPHPPPPGAPGRHARPGAPVHGCVCACCACVCACVRVCGEGPSTPLHHYMQSATKSRHSTEYRTPVDPSRTRTGQKLVR